MRCPLSKVKRLSQFRQRAIQQVCCQQGFIKPKRSLSQILAYSQGVANAHNAYKPK